MDPYATLFRNVLFPVWEGALRGRPTLSHLAALRRSEWASRDELRARQEGDLAKLLAHAYAFVPFFRRRMDDARVAPADVRALADLARLPLVTRRELGDTVRERSSIAPPFPSIAKSTSGSSGAPLTFGYDAGSEHWRQAIKLRAYGWAGVHPGDRALHYWGGQSAPLPPRQRAKVALDRRLRRDVYVDCGRRDRASLERVASLLRRLRPDALVCFAQAGADLARHLDEGGTRIEATRVLTGAERLMPSDRAALERVFGARVFETYGCREVMLIASECEAHAGLHVSMENLIVELVVRDGAHERPAAPGETGEVVITDLHNLGMPFIRYANGDLATAHPPGQCACGRSLDRLASVDGRVTETLRDGRGGHVSGLVFNVVVVGLADAIAQFQAVQHGDDSVTLRIVPRATFGDAARAALLGAAARYLPGLPVRIELLGELAIAPSGKRQVVIVEPATPRAR